jgi:hypothetical protein
MLGKDVVGKVAEPLLAAARAAVQERGPLPAEASIPLGEVLAQNRRLKQAAMALYTSLSEGCGSRDNPTRDLVSAVSHRQGTRELAFFRKTGWVKSDDDLGALLGEVSIHEELHR